MNLTLVKLIAAVPGIPMALNAVTFLTNPQKAVESLGMPLLDGMARSTQLGDFTAFFLGISVLIFLGAYKAKGHYLYAGALFLGAAAVFRSLSALVHGAELATVFIIIEAVLAGWLCASAYLLDKHSETMQD